MLPVLSISEIPENLPFQKVIELTGSRSELVSNPLPSDDPKQRKPDISLAKAKLGWEPKIPLTEGLKHTIAYFDALLKNA